MRHKFKSCNRQNQNYGISVQKREVKKVSKHCFALLSLHTSKNVQYIKEDYTVLK